MRREAVAPEPWRSFFHAINERLTTRVDLHCIGGFAFAMCHGLARPTGDIDVLDVVPATQLDELLSLGGEGGSLACKYRVHIQKVSIVHLPENYVVRLGEIFPGAYSRLRLFAPDPYDLALSKLERNADQDFEDVKYLARAASLDLDRLRTRYLSEQRAFVLRPEREDLTLQLWIDAIAEERGA
jgi:Nucleotidyltransferase of unknown function (DUF6036)